MGDQLRRTSSKELEDAKADSEKEIEKIRERIEQINTDHEESEKLKNGFIENLKETTQSLKKDYDKMKLEKDATLAAKQEEIEKLTLGLEEAKDTITEKEE